MTGAGQGIGYAIATSLAGNGCGVVVNDIHEEKAQAVVSAICADNGRAIAACADVSKSEAVDAMVERILEEFGRLDILVNNARPEPPRPAGLSLENWWDRVVDVALKGAYLCSIATLKGMKRQRYGRGGYTLDSGNPYRLWFGLAPSWVDNAVIRDGINRHGLLREAEEEFAWTS